MKKIMIVLLSGGTSSGKGTITKSIKEQFKDKIVVICLDDFVMSSGIITSRSIKEQIESHLNFNKPNKEIENRLLNIIKNIKQEKETEIQFKERKLDRPSKIVFKKIKTDNLLTVLIEGVHSLQSKELRKAADLRIYIDVESEVRLLRKIERSPWYRRKINQTPVDTREYGKNTIEAWELWEKGTKISEAQHVLPTKEYADLVLINDNEKDLGFSTQIIANLIESFQNKENFTSHLEKIKNTLINKKKEQLEERKVILKQAIQKLENLINQEE